MRYVLISCSTNLALAFWTVGCKTDKCRVKLSPVASQNARKKAPLPLGPPRARGIALLQGPTRKRFLMDGTPVLWSELDPGRRSKCDSVCAWRGVVPIPCQPPLVPARARDSLERSASPPLFRLVIEAGLVGSSDLSGRVAARAEYAHGPGSWDTYPES